MRKTILLTSLIPFSLVFGAPEDWTVDGPLGGNWGTAANWNPNVVFPNAQDQVVTIGTVVLTAACPVTQDFSPTVTVGSLTLQSTTAFGYTLSAAGTNSITFNVSSGSASLTVPVANTAAQLISAPLALVSNLSVVQDSVQSLTVSGVMSGNGSVTKSGTGLVILSGANTFSGGLTVSAGTLQTAQANVLPSSGTVTMSGGTLDLNNNGQVIGGLSGTAPITLGSGTLTVNTTSFNSYGGVISGTGSLSVGGTGALTLTSANGYTGGTTVTAGILQLGVNDALPAGRAVTMTGGTLALNNFNQSVGNLSGTGGAITLGSGQLSVALAAGQNFAGSISGAGTVAFDGNGFVWTLGALQAYTGGTTIDDGTLRLGVTGGLPAGGSVTLTATGILDLNNFAQTVGTLTAPVGAQVTLGSGQLTAIPTAAANFAGVISGTGGVTLQGSFPWTIQTAQTYTGGTTISRGSLQMGVANGLAPTGAVTVTAPGSLVLNNNPLGVASIAGSGMIDLGSATLTLNTTGTSTFSGSMVGVGGQLSVQGTGSQVLTGMSSYTGGTTVAGSATLEGNTNSLQGAIANGGTLYFNQGFNASYGGPLTGVGLLQVGGGGILTLTGTPAQGSALVQSGELDIAAGSTLTATTVTVDAGATIGGEGTFVANILNSGTINPGSVVTEGTLTVNGNVTFQPGSSYIANLTPIAADHLVVNGLVTINPGAQVIVDAQRGEYEEDTRYAIITSNQPVVGTFGGFQQTNPFLEVDFFYNQLLPGSVEIELQIKSLSDVIQGGNAGAIAKCITQAHMRADGDLEKLIADIIFFSVEQVRDILNEMQPSQLRALTVAEQTNAFFTQQTLNWRMAQFDKSTCEKEIASCFPWNFWVNLGGNWTDQRSAADHNQGYEAPGAMLTAGFDGKVAEDLYLGIASEYGYTALDWKEQRGSSTINRMSLGPYLSYVGRFGYVNASLLGSVAYFETKRHIPFFQRTASSSHLGETLLSHLDVGVVLHPAPNVAFIPFAALDFLLGWEGSYRESGAQSLNFSIASSSSSMFRSELGLKISKCATRSHTKWVHDLKASWVREERLSGKNLTATFRQFPCSFTVEGLFPSRNFLDLGMGLTFIFKKDRFAATLRYEGQFGEGVTLQSGTAQLLTRF
jgi:autotransporter-associated beta strand protein